MAVEILWRAAGKRDELLQAKHLLAWRLPVLDLSVIWESMEPATRANTITSIRRDRMRML